jgi:hypothetical protein
MPVLPLIFEPLTQVWAYIHCAIACLLDLALCLATVHSFFDRIQAARLAPWPRTCPDSHQPECARCWAVLRPARKQRLPPCSRPGLPPPRGHHFSSCLLNARAQMLFQSASSSPWARAELGGALGVERCGGKEMTPNKSMTAM